MRSDTLGYARLNHFYEALKRSPDAIPVVVIDGEPFFTISLPGPKFMKKYLSDTEYLNWEELNIWLRIADTKDGEYWIKEGQHRLFTEKAIDNYYNQIQ